MDFESKLVKGLDAALKTWSESHNAFSVARNGGAEVASTDPSGLPPLRPLHASPAGRGAGPGAPANGFSDDARAGRAHRHRDR